VIDGYRAGGDTSTISDVLDSLGLRGAVPATTLRPTIEGTRAVGQAITLRNAPEQLSLAEVAARGSHMDAAYVHRLARPGDMLVIQSVAGCSNFGGLASVLAQQAGESGAIVDGGVRDIEQSRSIGFPLWSRERTPISGKYRVHTVELNGAVMIAGIGVNPGDLVVADETGVCFIPFERAADVLAEVQAIVAKEAEMEKRMRASKEDQANG
jgi:regulator of RNase E activity RraA